MKVIDQQGLDGTDRLVHDVLSTVATAENTDVCELNPPLSDVIDPDALGRLVGSADRSTSVSFEYRGFEVVVRGDGDVRLAEL